MVARMCAPLIPSRALLASLVLLGACTDKAGPALVSPADDSDESTTDTPTADIPTDIPTDTSRPDTQPGTDTPSGLWVEDAAGVPVGLLVRRGSDDSTASRAIYDFVTVYHPASDLFFEVTMSDAVVRLPPNTFFQGFSCDTPVGIGIGACTVCKSAYSLGFLHGNRWWRVRGGVPFVTMGPGSVVKGGSSTECVGHGTANAKLFPIDQATGAAPPTSFAAPLRFVAR